MFTKATEIYPEPGGISLNPELYFFKIHFNIVVRLLKARIVKPADTAVARQWLSICHVIR
jgi:hypothetical protein